MTEESDSFAHLPYGKAYDAFVAANRKRNWPGDTLEERICEIERNARLEMLEHIKPDDFLLQRTSIDKVSAVKRESQINKRRSSSAVPQNQPKEISSPRNTIDTKQNITRTQNPTQGQVIPDTSTILLDRTDDQYVSPLFFPDPDAERETSPAVGSQQKAPEDPSHSDDESKMAVLDTSHIPESRDLKDPEYIHDDIDGEDEDLDFRDLDDVMQNETDREADELRIFVSDVDTDSDTSFEESEEHDDQSMEGRYARDPRLVVYPERYINRYGRPIKVHEYFGDEWSEMIKTLDNSLPIDQPKYCATELKPWQLTGVAKLKYLTSGPFSGGILGDEQGLGKTLTTITTLMEDILSNYTNEYLGFNLIVTTKTCVPQWLDEIKFHFGPEAASRSLYLNDPNMTASELLGGRYWFVLCTYQFVMNRYRNFQKVLMFHRVVAKIGLSQALKEISPSDVPDLRRRHINALYSEVYRLIGKPIRHLVLDEAQFVKNSKSITHQAMLNLFYNHVLLLSGTFIPNRWHDVFGLIRLLRGHPYKTSAQFMVSFAHKNILGKYQDPSASKGNRLVKFLQAFTVARPAKILNLEGLTIKRHDFVLDSNSQDAVAAMTQRFLKFAVRQKRDIFGGFSHQDDRNSQAMIFAMRAQQYCANVSMVSDTGVTAESIISQQTRALLQEFEDQQARGIALKELQESFKQNVATWAIETDEINEQPNEAEKDVQVEPSGQNDVASLRENTEQGLTLLTKHDRQKWIRQVRNMSKNDLWSPKVDSIIKLIHHITETWPQEKIVIFSKMLKFLDILDEAIRRDPLLAQQKRDSPFRFDGTLGSNERRQVKKDFSKPESRNMILITAGAGGAGMNLTAGSKIIQCEPWWTDTEQQQAYSRCYRFGQEKQVTVWILHGVNSVFDSLIEDIRDRKEELNHKIIQQLRRPDDEPVEIPRQFKAGIGEA